MGLEKPRMMCKEIKKLSTHTYIEANANESRICVTIKLLKAGGPERQHATQAADLERGVGQKRRGDDEASCGLRGNSAPVPGGPAVYSMLFFQ